MAFLMSHQGKSGMVFFLLPFAFFSFFPFGGFYHLDGDAICQVAYWKILFRPHLQGGIGAAQPKAGLIVLLGMAHDGSLFLFDSPDVFVCLLSALFAALLCFVVAVIAREIGGGVAGVAAMVLAVGMLMRGINTSQLFFLPVVFLGVWLLKRNLVKGVIVLGFASLFRIEAAGVLVLLACRQMFRGDRKDLGRTLVCTLFFTLLNLSIVCVVQGWNWTHLSSTYAIGYGYEDVVMFLEPKVVLGRTIGDIASRFYCNPLVPSTILLVPAIITLVGVKFARAYAFMGGILLVVMAHALFAGGAIGWRYFSFIDPFVIALGTGGIFRRKLGWGSERVGLWTSSLLVVLAVSYAAQSWYRSDGAGRMGEIVPGEMGSPKHDAWEFLEAPCIPPGVHVMGEDDILYVLLTRMPDYFEKMNSLQSFNVMSEERREQLFKEVDYIWIAKGAYPWYYLNYLPVSKWKADRFRNAIYRTLEGESICIYGGRLTPILNTDSQLILKVTPTLQ
jgi:hypothetical protein